jgi:PKD repeat protein
MKKYLFPFIIFSALVVPFANSQSLQPLPSNIYIPNEYPYWVDMMNDPNVNFYDVQAAFNRYFQDRPTGKGTGWKQFKRWEWYMEQRVYPSGNRIQPDKAWRETIEFRQQNSGPIARDASDWEELGPFTWTNVTGHWNPGMGRINAIARHPSDHSIVYIGAPSGGLWKTINEGETWVPLTDYIPAIGVSTIAIHPQNPDIIYIGTGDRDHDDTYSVGVLKSTDAGLTWEPTGLDWTVYQSRTVAKVLIRPDNPDVILAATTNGLFKSTDAGETWVQVMAGDVDDMEFKPGNPDVVYAVTKKIFRSTDGGETFTQVPDVPSGNRVQIAVTNANPEYVYYLTASSGIYRSTDGGETFEYRSSNPNPGYQAWYDLAIAASHTDPEEVHIGEINTYRSLNGGTSWVLTTDWIWGNSVGYTHCDIHEMVFYGDTLYIGSDGLISRSNDHGNNWHTFSDGLNIRQFYRIGGSKNSPYKILGGSQDNGTSVYTYDYWHEWLGADGMECLADWSDDNIVYGTSQNGSFYKSNTGGVFGEVNISQPGSGAWITPFVIHPADPNILFVGSNDIRKTTSGMQSWTTISSLSGGYVNGLAIAESNPDYLYVSKESDIWCTKNGGANWYDISPGLPNLYITYISVHPTDPELVAVTFSGYEEGHRVYISHDAGTTWQNYSGNLPTLPANCAVFYDDPKNPLYVGMDVGVYYRDNTTNIWEPFFNGLPNVIIYELEINKEAGKIRAGTFGRGLWESGILTSAPVAEFTSDQTTIVTGCAVNFTSLSSGPPESYEWHFEGGTPEFSPEKNPQGVVYETEGVFDVTLTVTNSLGTNTAVKEDYITVSATLLPGTDFTVEQTAVCTNTPVTFLDQTLYCPIAWFWEFEPATVEFVSGTTSNSQNPEVIFLENTSYTVSLTATNNIGEFTLTKPDYIAVGGLTLPFAEDFENVNLAASAWTVVNPDNGKTWEIDTIGGTTPGDHAAMVNIFNYQVIPGQRDQLVSPLLNLTGYPNAYLSFQHAYAKKYALITDSLIVYISEDCGDTWTRIFAGGDDGSGNFATHPQMPDEFIPQTSDDWCNGSYGANCQTIDLSAWTEKANLRLMFETYHYLGNNIFIDNVSVFTTVGITGPISGGTEIQVFPNPTPGLFTLQMDDPSPNIIIRIIDLHGKVIYSERLLDKDGQYFKQIDLGGYPEGVYILEVKSSAGSQFRKVVVGVD